MNLSCRGYTALLLALAAPAQEPAIRYVANNHPIEVGPKQRGKEWWQGCRVVDAVTGKPIAGAELFLVFESNTPVAGRFTWERRVNSDADGFAALPMGEYRDGWLILRAPGHGPVGSIHAAPGLIWALQPALDVPVRILDWMDRPVPGAGIGLCLGCGHSPDVLNATADQNGIAVLHGMDPYSGIADLYPEHPDLGIEDYAGVDWSPGDPPAVVRASRGEPSRGVVLGADGKPVANGFVGTKNKHRGPWTATRADGTFQLDGAEPGADLFVVTADKPDHEYLFERPWQQPMTLRLPVQNGDTCQLIELPRPEGEKRELRLELRGPDGALTDAPVVVFGPLPMRHSTHGETGADGVAAFQLTAGEYEVQCSLRGFDERAGTVAVAATGPTSRTLQLQPLPTVRVDAPDGCQVTVLWQDSGYEVTDLVAAKAPVPIPVRGDFGFMLERGDDRRTIAFSNGARPQAAVQLRFLPKVRVRTSLVDSAGAPVAAHVALLRRQQFFGKGEPADVPVFTGAVELEDTEAGLHVLAVRPERADLRPRLLAVSLPARAEGAVLDLGAVSLSAVPRLRILDASGQRYAGAAAGITRTGLGDVSEKPPSAPLDADGGWLGLEPVAGDAIVVPAAAWDLDPEAGANGEAAVDVPFRTVLQEPGPWTITVPAGALHLRVTDGDKDLDAVVYVADRAIEVHGPVLLRQLPAGPLDLVIAAAGRKSALVKVDIRGAETTELKVPLPPE